MKTIGKEQISFTVKDRAAFSPFNGVTKTLVVKHEAVAGQLLIDFNNPTAPASSVANGFVQPSAGDLAAIDFLTYKANLRITSSRGVDLVIFDDFKVTGQKTIQLIGSYASTGALEGEIFTAHIGTVPASLTLVNEAKIKTKTYTLAINTTTLNLGEYYTVGKNLSTGEQVGEIRVYRNGALQLRTVDNLPANEGNYYEVGTAGGLSNQIIFLEAPSVQDDSVVVEFGYESAGDVNIVSSMESLYGGFKKLISDVAGVFGWDESRYYSFNPSDLDRRAFGDRVQSSESRITALEAVPLTIRAQSNNGNLYTPTTSSRFYGGATSVLTVPAGTWAVHGFIFFTQSGGSAGLSRTYASWTSVAPVGEAVVQPPEAVNLVSGTVFFSNYVPAGTPEVVCPVVTVEMVNSSPTQIFLSPYGEMSTPANSRILTGIWAHRIKA